MCPFCKILLSFLLFFVSTSTAYYREDEPSLVSGNLKLASLGNLNLVLEEYENEINLYDFGKLPAGIINDDNGKSSIYIRSKYGFDGLKEKKTETEWSGGNIAIGGIYKYMRRWAIGGSLSGQKRDLRFYSPWEMHRDRYNIKNTCDTIIGAWHTSNLLNLGLRVAYRRDMMEKTEYINPWEFNGITWSTEPSMSINLLNSKWCLGLGYKYTEDDWNSAISRNLKLPIVYKSQNLSLGIKFNYKLTYRLDDFLSNKEIYGGIRGLYNIPISDKTMNIGFLIDRDITYEYSEHHEPIYNWFMDFGGGVALVDEDLGLVGMQIQQKIYHRYAPAYPKQTIFNLGLEFNHFEVIPIRLGYLFHSWNPEVSYSNQSIITVGFGIYLLEKRTKIDFAYNLRIASSTIDQILYYETYHDIQNILGISGRFTF